MISAFPAPPVMMGLNSLITGALCLVVSGGFELIFDGPIADVAWLVLRPGLDVDAITWVIEDSGLEDYFDVMIVTPGCGDRSAVIIIPRDAQRLTELYRPSTTTLGAINCRAPSRESYNAWLSIVDGLIRSLGIDELTKHAINMLSIKDAGKPKINKASKARISSTNS